MATKTIAFFVRTISSEDYPFSSRDLYYHSYQENLLAMKRAGAEVYFVTDNESYQGAGKFSNAWTIDSVSEVADFTEVGAITADLVFDKGGFEGDDVKVVTDHRLLPVIDDKAETYRVFSEYQPASIICANNEEVQAAIVSVEGEMVVVKSLVGSGGKQVYIGTKESIMVPETEVYPLIVQEFIDMSGGIPGLAEGVHDVRVLIAGGSIIGATLRQPSAGSLYANVSKGGIEQLLSIEQIPAELIPITNDIDQKLCSRLGVFPRYYAADFALGKKGWKLVELNYKPGLFRFNTDKNAPGIINRFAEYMVSL